MRPFDQLLLLAAVRVVQWPRKWGYPYLVVNYPRIVEWWVERSPARDIYVDDLPPQKSHYENTRVNVHPQPRFVGSSPPSKGWSIMEHFIKIDDLGILRPCPQGTRIRDTRFRDLVAPEQWARLSKEVAQRFSVKTRAGDSIVFTGRIGETKISALGKVLVQMCRLIGAPLPISADPGRASVVTITEDAGTGGQNWTRLYARAPGFPQIIHSSKRFAGPTGLEEHVGYGIGMTLNVSVDQGGLVFESDRYFATILGRRIYLPKWLSPGHLTVKHLPLGPDHFAFTLDIQHPVFGCLIDQRVIFEGTPT